MGKKITRTKTQMALESFTILEQQFPHIQSQLTHKLDEKLLSTSPINDSESNDFQSFTQPLIDTLTKYKKTFSSYSQAIKNMPEADEESLEFKEIIAKTMSRISQIQEDLEAWKEQAADKIMLHNMSLGYFCTDPVIPEPATTNSDYEEETQPANK